MTPKISVCVTTFNRPKLLDAMLESVLAQNIAPYEIVICENNSPRRLETREVVQRHIDRNPGLIRYYENAANLGYDGNIREVVSKATGDYCFFMSDDDLMAPRAIETVAKALERHANVGVIMRSYLAFNGTPDHVDQVFRYFDQERVFPPGPETMITFFRRCIVISGLVLHRELSQKYATDRLDGSLLYQLHLAGHILRTMKGLFLPDILSYYRNGGTPDFGLSPAEQGLFVPQQQPPASSVHFVRGFLRVAKDLEDSSGLKVYQPIFRDQANYSYPLLWVQAKKGKLTFLRYATDLGRLGFWKNPMYVLYFTLLFCVGRDASDGLIRLIKRVLGHTPRIGYVYDGATV